MYSRILSVIIFLAYITSISACGLFSAKTKLGPASSTTERADGVSDDPAVSSKNLNSSSSEDQTVAATDKSNIGGSSASFAPGSLSIDTTVSVEDGVSLSENNLLPSELGLSGDTSISAQGEPVAVTASNDVSLTSPMALSIPLPASAGLKLAEEQLDFLIVIFRIKIFGIVYSGIIPRSFLNVKDNMVNFEHNYFGVFQTVYTKILFTKGVEIKSNYKNITAKEHKSNPEPIVEVPPPEPEVVSVAFSSPNPSSLIDDSNKSSFAISGTCSEDGEPVHISGAKTYSATCSSALWSTNFDLAALADGPVSFAANHSSSTGTAATEATISFTKSTTASIINVTSAKPDDYYPSGTSIDITVQFSKSITVAGGPPTLSLSNGATATYTSTASDTLTFNYTVSGGGGEDFSDLDYASTSALSLAGATIKDSGNTAASLTLATPGSAGSLSDNKNLVIDTTSPTSPTATNPAAYGNSTVSFAWTGGTDANLEKFSIKACTSNDCATGCTSSQYDPASPYSFTGLVEGPGYYACVKAVDYAGNTSAYDASASTVSIDTTAPSTVTATNPPTYSNSSVNFAWSGGTDTNFDTFNVKACTNNDCSTGCTAPQTDNASPLSFTGLVDGTSYYVCVQAADLAGNTTAYDASATTVAYDVSPPSALSVVNPPAYGSSTVNFAWTGGTDANFDKFYVKACTSNDCSTGCASSTADTASPFAHTGLVDGTTYYACVKSTDLAGNSTPFTASSTTVTIDTTAPTFTSIAWANAATDGYINQAENAASTALVATPVGSDYDTAEYVLKATGTTCDGALTYGSLAKSDDATFVADGDYKVCVKLTDNAGNSPAYGSTSSDVTLDKTVPAFTSLAWANAATDSYINDAENSASTDLVDSLVAAGQDTTEYSLEASATACASAASWETLPKSNSADFGADGDYKVCVKLSDNAGNPVAYGDTATNVTLDTAWPSFTSLTLANAASDSYITAPENAASTDLVGTLTASNYDTAEYKLAALATTCDIALTYGAIPKSDNGEFGSDGDYKVCVDLYDNAGNHTYNNSPTIALETSVPAFTSIAWANAAADGYINLAENGASTDLVSTLVGTGYTTAEYVLKATGTTCDGALTYGALSKSDDATFVGDGDYKVCVKLTDAAGNPPTYGATSSDVTLDKTVPAFTSIAWANAATDGFINDTENSASTDLVDTLVGTGYTTADYVLKTTGTTCNVALTYGTLSKSDSSNFVIDGDYKVCVKLIDDAGNPPAYGGTSSDITLDTTSPSVSNVTSADPNSYYKNSDSINLTVSFIENVTVNTTGGVPTLTLNSGGSATYSSGTGGTTLTFNYTVSGGNNSADLDYSATTSLVLNSGTIKDSSGNSATLTLSSPGSIGSLGNNKAIVIDTLPPTSVTTSDSGSPSVIPVSTSWSGGTDTYSDNFNIKACANSGCSSGCGSVETDAASPYNYTDVVDTNTYYMCVQAVDLAGNTSAWDASTNTVLINANPPPTWVDEINDLVLKPSVSVDSLNVFADADDSGDTITYSLDLVNMDCDEAGWTLQVNINSSTGQLTGTPPNVGFIACSIKIKATDTGASFISQEVDIVILPPSIASGTICTTGTLADTCAISSNPAALADGDAIWGSGNIVIDAGITISAPAMAKIWIDVQGDVTINGTINANLGLLRANNITLAGAGLINADGLGNAGGYNGAAGSGAGGGEGGQFCTGCFGSYRYSGGGGGYGGIGGGGRIHTGWPTPSALGPSSLSFGAPTSQTPIDFGSGGGGGEGTYGGRGGGAVKIVAMDTLAVNGLISVNGLTGDTAGAGSASHDGGGGGSGGSVWTTAAVLTGSGNVTANGGNGGNDDNGAYYGGGGGGGRTGFHQGTNSSSFTSNTATGGDRGQSGHAECADGTNGTVYFSP